jgi:hypothetical protein
MRPRSFRDALFVWSPSYHPHILVIQPELSGIKILEAENEMYRLLIASMKAHSNCSGAAGFC